MNEVIFEAGDVVTCAFFGDEEFVLEKSNKSISPYPIHIKTSTGSYWCFTTDGKYHVSNTAPILKLVRKKSKERELVEIYRVSCDNESFQLIKEFESYEDAFTWIRRNGIPSWEYQIEKVYKVKE